MKLTSLLFSLLFISVLFTSCSDDEKDGIVKISFKVEYDQNPMVITERYDYPLGFQIFFDRFSFFASNIQLLKSNSAIEVNDVEYWNFRDSHASLDDATKGLVLNYDKIPAGNYNGISFGLGVPTALNSQSPADFDSANPLSNTAEYWEDWNSYIFMKTEGKMDPDGDGIFDDGFALHLGSDDAYRSVVLSKSFTVSAGETTEIEFVVDLKDMFNL